ncbi:hypothetical protein [Cohnella rhizosphaerae]|uniref:Uncharacterized protein n=1 Tax=Cohnella rhizosphaerae TaxID=1457232 RepID=A0A9X4KVS2_9BACL|nr:hypothetical protein [Cohnella rhizosphaerae]MDG0812074.1 hypothetical protein [Cohnella rhizosphaerae]
MRKNAERDVRQRSRAALLAGAAAVVLLAWGWLAPADGSVPGWEPVNAQVAAAVADAEIGEGEARRAGGEAGLAHAAATAATDRPADTAGVAEPAGEVSGAAAVSASEANAGASAAPASEANAVNTGGCSLKRGNGSWHPRVRRRGRRAAAAAG